MKNILLLALLLTCLSSAAQYDFDRNDFFEIGASIGTFADYKMELTDIRGESVVEYNSLKSRSAGLRYGKAVMPFAHIVFGINFGQREEVFAQKVDLSNGEILIVGSERVSIFSTTVEFGPRIRIIGTDVFEFSIAGGGFGRYASASEKNLQAGYYAHGVIGFNFNERIQINGKYGYDTTEGMERVSSFPAELAFHYKIY